MCAYERRHGSVYVGLDIPLGAEVTYRPPTPVLKQKHKLDTTMSKGIFLGWKVAPGGVWHGDYLVAETTDLLENKSRDHLPFGRRWPKRGAP